jgi:transposase-like protein
MDKPKPSKVTPPPAAERREAERSDAERSGAAGGGARPILRRWTAARKLQLVLRLLRGESLEAVSRECGIPTWKLAKWRDRALTAMQNGLSERPREIGEVLDEQKDSLIAKLAMENDLLKKKTAGKVMRWKP